MYVLMLTKLKEIPDRLNQRPSQSPQRVRTLDTNDDETDTTEGSRKVLSKKALQNKKVYGASELGRLFVKARTDAANKTESLLMQNVPKRCLGPHTRTSWSFATFPGDSTFCPRSTSAPSKTWVRVLEFHGWLMMSYNQQRKDKIKKDPFVVRVCEHPFAEELIPDGAGAVDTKLPILAKVSCLTDVLKMGRSYEFVENIKSQFVVTAGLVNAEVAWTHDEVVVISIKLLESFCLIPGVNSCFTFSWSSWLKSCSTSGVVLLLFLVNHMCWLTSKATIWVLGLITKVPNFRAQTFREMHAKGLYLRFRDFGSIFHVVVHHHQTQGSWAPQPDDVTFWSTSYHRYFSAVKGVVTWDRQQHCGSLVSHRGVPQWDRKKDWRRQLSCIVHSLLNFTRKYIHTVIVLFLI